MALLSTNSEEILNTASIDPKMIIAQNIKSGDLSKKLSASSTNISRKKNDANPMLKSSTSKIPVDKKADNKRIAQNDPPGIVSQKLLRNAPIKRESKVVGITSEKIIPSAEPSKKKHASIKELKSANNPMIDLVKNGKKTDLNAETKVLKTTKTNPQNMENKKRSNQIASKQEIDKKVVKPNVKGKSKVVFSPVELTTKKSKAGNSHLKKSNVNEAKIKTFSEMPHDFRRSMPKLDVNVHVYDVNAENRFALISLQRYHEGDKLNGGVLIVEITEDGFILKYKGKTFSYSNY